MFTLQNVTLLQPEEVFAQRLRGGGDALSKYLAMVRASLCAYYEANTAPGVRALFIALGPNSKQQFWLAGASPSERSVVHDLSRVSTPPVVQDGPIALALVYTVGVVTGPLPTLTTPPEWQAVVQVAGRALSIDDIVLALWSNADP